MLFAASAGAQYPGLINKTDKSTPELRSVAVLEWTGEPGKPSASRLVPIAVYDGQQFNDGTLYLDRPQPMALAGGVEYELQTAGKAVGIFDVYDSVDVKGAWLGFGAWKPLSAAETAKADNAFNTSQLYGGDSKSNADDDQPVLKRKHPKGSDSDDSAKNPPADQQSSAGGAGIGSATTAASGTAPAKDDDPDRPKLKRKSTDSSTSDSTASSTSGAQVDPDPDRPTIRRKKSADDFGMMETSTAAPDPDRPRLKRGKPDSLANTESPRLTGYPPTLQQSVAVSDASNRAEHPWKYTWANPADETRMKEALEAIARTALGLDPPPKPVKKTATSKTTPGKRPLTPLAPPEPVKLVDEQFRVFELAYGANATLVLTAASPAPPATELPSTDSASTASATASATPDRPIDPGDHAPVIQRGKPASGITTAPIPTQPVTAAKTAQPKSGTQKAVKPPAKPTPQKFVTLIAQPDLYGGLIVLYKSVTDTVHLDETPRMRLVDAVDAEGDNRGELLFELRGTAQRQFAMYRVLRGSAEQLFATVAMP